MTRSALVKSLASASFLAVCVVAGPASAQSARDQVLAVSKATIELSGAKVTWGRIDGDDAKFTVTGTTIKNTTEGKSSTLGVQTLTFVGAKPTSDGGFTADEIGFDKLEIAESDGKLTIDHASATKVVARAPEVVKKTNGLANMLEAFEMTGIVVVGEDKKTIPIVSVRATSADWVDGMPRKGSLDIRGITVPIDPKDDGAKELIALGYGTVSADVSISGSWDDKTGRLEVQQTTAGANMGGLEIALAIGGLTPDVIAKMRAAGEDQAKQLELLQGLTLEKARVRWSDASLTGRILSAQAKDQGVDVPTFTKQIKLMVPMLVSMIGNKDFEGKITKAAGAYLDAPKSLTVTAKPAQPMPLAQLMGAAMMAPQSLPTVLGADVTAND